MSDPPTAIRVGPYTYRLEMRPDDDGAEIWGRIRFKERSLRVDPSMPHAMRRAALLHEVAHAVNDLGGVSVEKYWPKTEEQHVTVTAPLWLLVLRDNPGLVAYLLDDDDG